MPVAPSFQNYEQIGEPFIENKKSYVIVRHPNTHNDRKVRWYSPTEFAKLYPQQAKQVDIFTIRSQKDVMGFEKGFITVLKPRSTRPSMPLPAVSLQVRTQRLQSIHLP